MPPGSVHSSSPLPSRPSPGPSSLPSRSTSSRPLLPSKPALDRATPAGLPNRPPINWGRGMDAPRPDTDKVEREEGEEAEDNTFARRDRAGVRGGQDRNRVGRERERSFDRFDAGPRYEGRGGRRRSWSRSRSRSRSRSPPRRSGGYGDRDYRGSGRDSGGYGGGNGGRDYRRDDRSRERERDEGDRYTRVDRNSRPRRRSPSPAPYTRRSTSRSPAPRSPVRRDRYSRAPSSPVSNRYSDTYRTRERSTSYAAESSSRRYSGMKRRDSPSPPPRRRSPSPPPCRRSPSPPPRRRSPSPPPSHSVKRPRNSTPPRARLLAPKLEDIDTPMRDLRRRSPTPPRLAPPYHRSPPPPPRRDSPPTRRIVPLAETAPDPSIPTGPRNRFPAQPPRPRTLPPVPRPPFRQEVRPQPRPFPARPPTPTREPTPPPIVRREPSPLPAIPTGPKGWRPPTGPRAVTTVVVEKSAEEVAREKEVLEAREREREAREAAVEERKRMLALQRWLPKGLPMKVVSVGAEFEVEIQRQRLHRLTQLLPAQFEAAVLARSAQADLAMGCAERDLAKERVRMAGGSGVGGVPMGVGISAGL